MCGIFGQITPGRPVDPIACLAAVNSMRHRGPDGLGIAAGRLARQSAEFARNPESDTVAARCARSHADFLLGHRRLAVVDLDEAAYQPMANEDGTVWVVFNGEVYNHQSLRETLSARGHRFKTDHSDTEALVHGYEQWGEQLLERLRGMFALAVLDLRRRRLLLARDRFGEKPLYYRRHAGGIAFASEIKAIGALSEVKGRSTRRHWSTMSATGSSPPRGRSSQGCSNSARPRRSCSGWTIPNKPGLGVTGA